MSLSRSAGPATKAAAVAPSDTIRFEPTTQIIVGKKGDISMVTAGDNSTILFRDVPNNYVFDIAVIGVNKTNTTASDIVRLWT